MDLEFIAKNLMDSTPNANGPVNSEKENSINSVSKLSLADYLLQKKKLQSLEKGSPLNIAGFEFVSEDDDDDSDSSDEEVNLEEGETEAVGYDSDNPVDEKAPKTKHEVDELPPINPLPITEVSENASLIHVGVILSIVNDMVLIQSDNLGYEVPALDIGSLLILPNRIVLGEIYDTFGQVNKPIYVVRIDLNTEWDNNFLKVGSIVFRVADYSKIITPEVLSASKGTDASNMFDEELGDDEQEFSDDEQEQQFKKGKKNNGKSKNIQNQSLRQPQTISPSTNQSLNYYLPPTPIQTIQYPQSFPNSPYMYSPMHYVAPQVFPPVYQRPPFDMVPFQPSQMYMVSPQFLQTTPTNPPPGVPYHHPGMPPNQYFPQHPTDPRKQRN